MKLNIKSHLETFKVSTTGAKLQICIVVDGDYEAYLTFGEGQGRTEYYEGETEAEALQALLEGEDEQSTETVLDWSKAAFERLQELANGEDCDEVRAAVDALTCLLPEHNTPDFNPHNAETPEHVFYMGDVNPIDHDGSWYDTRYWKDGHANCVRCQSSENTLWIETGMVNNTETKEDVAQCYGIELDEVTEQHEIDYNATHWGIEDETAETFTRLGWSDWYVDSEGNMVPASHIEALLTQKVATLGE